MRGKPMEMVRDVREPDAVVHVGAGQQGGYDVCVGSGILAECGTRLARICGVPCHALVVTDDTVASLWLDALKSSLHRAGFAVSEFVFAHGEASKTISTWAQILEHAAAEQLTRSDIVVTLGGGVPGDMGGFAAACYLRGIRFAQVPTTLLAAVDASVGGKTAVDLAAGKNLAGAFHQPVAVLCDIDTLATLPPRELSCGVAEAYKTAVLADAALFDLIASGVREHLQQIIARCVSIKRDYVEADEREAGVRRFLNLGHTFGHAIETCSGFELSHGAAVAVGMVMAARYAAHDGQASPELASQLAAAFETAGLPSTTDIPVQQLAQAALADKKRRGSSITLVLPRKVGECYLKTIDIAELPQAFAVGTGATV